MKRLLNRSRLIWLVILAFTSAVVLSSCDKEELEIHQNYPFEVKVMPVPGEVASGQTVEIRMTIERDGNFNDTEYFIRYFQFDGQGTLQYYNEPPYLPNDLYQLPATQFRLHYTSQSTVTQSFDVWISDSFRNERQVSFQFKSGE